MAQNLSFMVKPMRIMVSGRPGEVIETTLEIRSTQAEAKDKIIVGQVNLGQKADGSWDILPEDVRAQYSNISWLKISDSDFEIEPASTKEVKVSFTVPRNGRGTYFSGIVVRSVPRESAKGGIPIVVQFLIPTFVEVIGTPGRQQVSLTGLGIEKIEKDKSAAIIYSAENIGDSMGELSGTIDVFSEGSGRAKRIGSYPIKSIFILPGSKLHVATDIGTNLPNGEYNLRARLMINGRQLRPFMQDCSYEGGNGKGTTNGFTLPESVAEITAKSGSTQTQVLKISNSGDALIAMKSTVLPHPDLRQKMIGTLDSSKLSCAGWVTTQPASGEIRPGRQLNFRIRVQPPRESDGIPNHYCIVSLTSESGGEKSGKEDLLVIVHDPNVTEEKRLAPDDVLIRTVDGDKVAITTTFSNVGNAHGVLAVKGIISDVAGLKSVKTLDFGDTSDIFLPFQKRTVSADVNLEGLAPGAYSIEITADLSGEKVNISKPIEVVKKGDQLAMVLK